jgi:hypothetical protein
MVNYLDAVDGFIRKFQAAKILPLSETEELFRQYARVASVYPRHDSDMVSSHNDLKPENILFDSNHIWLVDWEAAFLNDRYVDLRWWRISLSRTMWRKRLIFRPVSEKRRVNTGSRGFISCVRSFTCPTLWSSCSWALQTSRLTPWEGPRFPRLSSPHVGGRSQSDDRGSEVAVREGSYEPDFARYEGGTISGRTTNRLRLEFQRIGPGALTGKSRLRSRLFQHYAYAAFNADLKWI